MKHTSRISIVVISAVAAVSLAAQPAWAARMRVHEMAESPAYKQKFGGMLGRGVLNAATFFVDLIVNTVNDTRTGPPLIGTLTGVAKGAGCSVLRLGSGAVDVVTSWVPGFNGFPVSDDYSNCLGAASSAPAAVSQIDMYETPQPLSTPVVFESAGAAAEAPLTTAESSSQTEPAQKWTK